MSETYFDRLPASVVAAYMKAYAERLGIADRVLPGTTVTSVKVGRENVRIIESFAEAHAWSVACGGHE